MSNDKIIDINKEAAQYLESSRKKLRRLSADWDDYAAEVPQKLIQLIKSGIKPKIERGNSGGRQLSVNLSFETNTDAAKEYIQTIQPTATKKAQVFADEFSDINKKLEYYYEQGIDSKVFSSLVKLLKSYADFMKSAQIDIRGNIISMNIPKEVDTVVSKWTKINDKQARENEAKRLGVNVEDLDNHKKYLDAKHKKDTARTSAVMNQAYKLFASIEGYLDSSSLAMECKNKAEELKSQEEEAERKRLEEERLRKEEEERQRKEKIYNEVVGLMNQATTSKQCEEVIKQFQDIKGFKDVDTLIEECINKKNAFEEQEEKARIEAERKKEEERKNGLYEEALFAMNQGTKSSYKDAVVLFKEIEDYKDSKEKIDECEKKIKDIEEREEKARIEAEERRKEEERKAKEEKEKRLKKKKKYMSLISIISIIVIVISIAVPYYKNVIAPSMKYNKAMDLLEDKEFDEAYTLFEELGSYKDCEDMLNETRYQQAMYCFENKDYETAMTLFDELGYYESSSRMYSQSCHYLGQQYLEAGEYEKAEDVLSHVRYATDSKDLYNEAAYQLGIQYFSEGKYDEGYSMLYSIRGYKDALDQAYELLYQQGLKFYEAKDFDKSNEIFKKLAGYRYKDSDQLIHNHVFKEKVITELTCEVDGEIEYTCSCGYSEIKTTEATGHQYTEATCTEPSKCSKCGLEQSPALGHTMVDHICSTCGYNDTQPITFSGSSSSNTTEKTHSFSVPAGKYKITMVATPKNTNQRWSVKVNNVSLYFGYYAATSKGTYTATVNIVGTGNSEIAVKINGKYKVTIEPYNE